LAKIRLFLVNTCLSTVYSAIHARENSNPGGRDILAIDSLRLRPSERQLIEDAAGLHGFDEIIDFSQKIAEVQSYAPSWRKRLTRKYKEKALIKPLYEFLFRIKSRREAEEEKVRIVNSLGIDSKADLQIFLQPRQLLTPVLKEAYQAADFFHLEHGLGDYHDVQTLPDSKLEFLCVFAESFGVHLQEKQVSRILPKEIFPPAAFEQTESGFRKIFPQLGKIEEALPQQDKLVLILIQPLEQQQIPLAFWDFFLDQSIQQLPDPQGRFFLVKPHPKQAEEVTSHVMSYFEKRGLPALVWNEPEVRALSIEIIFTSLRDKIEAVFSPSSSSIFYLPKLFPNSKTRFYYSLRFVLKFADQTSDMFRNRWIDALPLFEKVFGVRTEELKAENEK
jgi:hypothetical protein